MPECTSCFVGAYLSCSAKNECGMAVSTPAPSPVLLSQPHAPRCAIRISIVLASCAILFDGSPSMLTMNPTPHASFSNDASYKPTFSGKPVDLLIFIANMCFTVLVCSIQKQKQNKSNKKIRACELEEKKTREIFWKIVPFFCKTHTTTTTATNTVDR